MTTSKVSFLKNIFSGFKSPCIILGLLLVKKSNPYSIFLISLTLSIIELAHILSFELYKLPPYNLNTIKL